MVTVAVDTSALMLPVELDIRLFEELERLLGDVDVVVPQAVVDELERLGAGDGTPSRAARVGMDLVERGCRVVESTTTVADDAVLALAVEGSATYLVTADRALAERARSAAVPAITPRGRRQLSVRHP